MLRCIFYLLILITGLSSGCATAPYVAPTVTPVVPGIYHRIEKGQTLWRISKIYDISLEELSRANNITEAANIEVGQRIFIPRRRQVEPPVGVSYGEDFFWPVRGNVIATFGQQSNSMVNKGINIRVLSRQA
jgi:LysM repeat protein